MSDITVHPIAVVTDDSSREGRLILLDGSLVAVVSWVSTEETQGSEVREGWFLEAGFGPCGSMMTASQPVFATIDDAVAWVHKRVREGMSS